MKNLTPHPIAIRCPDGDVTFYPSGRVARIYRLEEPAGRHNPLGCPLIRRTEPQFSQVSGIPTEKERLECGGVLVSSVVLEALHPSKAAYVYSPDTGPESAVRDEDGQIIAVKRLVCK